MDSIFVRDICSKRSNRPDALLEIMHEVQSIAGYLSDEALLTIADALNISKAEVHGVVSFYHDFKKQRPPSTVLKICGAEACQAVGSRSLIDYAKTKCSDAAYTDASVEVVYCLGNCALGPAVMVDDHLHGRMSPTALDTLISKRATNKKGAA